MAPPSIFPISVVTPLKKAALVLSLQERMKGLIRDERKSLLFFEHLYNLNSWVEFKDSQIRELRKILQGKEVILPFLKEISLTEKGQQRGFVSVSILESFQQEIKKLNEGNEIKREAYPVKIYKHLIKEGLFDARILSYQFDVVLSNIMHTALDMHEGAIFRYDNVATRMGKAVLEKFVTFFVSKFIPSFYQTDKDPVYKEIEKEKIEKLMDMYQGLTAMFADQQTEGYYLSMRVSDKEYSKVLNNALGDLFPQNLPLALAIYIFEEIRKSMVNFYPEITGVWSSKSLFNIETISFEVGNFLLASIIDRLPCEVKNMTEKEKNNKIGHYRKLVIEPKVLESFFNSNLPSLHLYDDEENDPYLFKDTSHQIPYNFPRKLTNNHILIICQSPEKAFKVLKKLKTTPFQINEDYFDEILNLVNNMRENPEVNIFLLYDIKIKEYSLLEDEKVFFEAYALLPHTIDLKVITRYEKTRRPVFSMLLDKVTSRKLLLQSFLFQASLLKGRTFYLNWSLDARGRIYALPDVSPYLPIIFRSAIYSPSVSISNAYKHYTTILSEFKDNPFFEYPNLDENEFKETVIRVHIEKGSKL